MINFLSIVLVCVDLVFAANFAHDSKILSPTTNRHQVLGESDLDSADTFHRPALIIRGNPIFGHFGHPQPGPQGLSRLPAGVLLTYSPPPPNVILPQRPSNTVPSASSESSSIPELPGSWSPLVASGDKSENSLTVEPSGEEVIKSEGHTSEQLPPQIRDQMRPQPPFMFQERPMIPYRQPGFLSPGYPVLRVDGQHNGLGPNFGQISILKKNPTTDQEIKESTRSVSHSDTDLAKADESTAQAGFIETNWIALASTIILLITGTLGLIGYFIWKRRVGGTDIAESATVTRTATTVSSS